MNAFLKQHKSWLLPLCLGATIPPLVWFFVFRDYIVPGTKSRHSSIRLGAKLLKVKEDDLISLTRVDVKLADNKAPTESDWQLVKAFVTGRDASMQAISVRTLRGISKYGHKEECIGLVDSILNNPANQTQDRLVAYSLISLYDMQAPDWRDQVGRFRNSHAELTAFAVDHIQQKEAGKK